MSDADCTPGREPRSVAASTLLNSFYQPQTSCDFCCPSHLIYCQLPELLCVLWCNCLRTLSLGPAAYSLCIVTIMSLYKIASFIVPFARIYFRDAVSCETTAVPQLLSTFLSDWLRPVSTKYKTVTSDRQTDGHQVIAAFCCDFAAASRGKKTTFEQRRLAITVNKSCYSLSTTIDRCRVVFA